MVVLNLSVQEFGSSSSCAYIMAAQFSTAKFLHSSLLSNYLHHLFHTKTPCTITAKPCRVLLPLTERQKTLGRRNEGWEERKQETSQKRASLPSTFCLHPELSIAAAGRGELVAVPPLQQPFGPAQVIHRVDPLLATLEHAAWGNCPPLCRSFCTLLPGDLAIIHSVTSSKATHSLITVPHQLGGCQPYQQHKQRVSMTTYHRTHRADCIHPSQTSLDKFSAPV